MRTARSRRMSSTSTSSRSPSTASRSATPSRRRSRASWQPRYTSLDDAPDLWVGVLTFAGEHTTSGLDMPLFFGPDADPGPGHRRTRRCVRARTPAAQAARHGGPRHHVHGRHRDRPRRRHRDRRLRRPALPARAQARAGAARWGDDPLRAAGGMGQRDVPLADAPTSSPPPRPSHRAGAGVVEPGSQRDRALDIARDFRSARRWRCSTRSRTPALRSTRTRPPRSMRSPT